MKPYYADELVSLYLGDCLEITAWLEAHMLVTDPPYGIGWTRSANMKHGIRSKGHGGIKGDTDTSVRDSVLTLWGARPGVLFGSFYAPQPPGLRQVLVYRKPPDSGLVGSTTGYRRDVEPVYLTGPWPQQTAQRSALLTSNARLQGGPGGTSGRYGHPHAKPVDVMETLIGACPPGVIADPFAGSGSTLVAARNLGRRAIGVELDERYCELAARRLSQMTFTLDASGQADPAATGLYLAAITRLSAALRAVCGETGTSTTAHHIARKALDDLDQPQLLPDLRGQLDEARTLLLTAAEALWNLTKAALTVKTSLDTPYPDAAHLTPWTRWVERPAHQAHDVAMAIRRHLRERAGTITAAPDSARDALDAQTLHDSPGSDLEGARSE